MKTLPIFTRQPANMQPRNLRSKLTLRVLAVATITLAASCSAPNYKLDETELARFMAAGPITPEFDEERLLESIAVPGPYRVGSGDLLMVRAPATMVQTGSAALTITVSPEPVELFARVADDGTIDIPLAGTIEARGLTAPELERKIANAVYPKFLSERPSIVATVEEPATVTVTVYGAVEDPGIHKLTADRMSLSGALTVSGGIAGTVGNLIAGARKIIVYRPPGTSADPQPAPEVVALPIRGLNIPFYDLALEGGERIEVERYEPDRFTVVGLVSKPGAHEYPPETSFNLLQAVAIAGGVDRISDPPYATIFRKDLKTGEVLPATFKIKGNGLVAASSLHIKPGDVISIGHTKGSWTRAFFREIFRINIGFFPNSSF